MEAMNLEKEYLFMKYTCRGTCHGGKHDEFFLQKKRNSKLMKTNTRLAGKNMGTTQAFDHQMAKGSRTTKKWPVSGL